MNILEYQIAFMTIIIGLGVTDLFNSLVKLLKSGNKVKWHWLPILWVLIALMGLIIAWFAYYSIYQHSFTKSGPGFLLSILPAISIFAFTVSILPHQLPQGGVELKTYYFQHNRLIFSFFFLDMFSRNLTQILFLETMEISFWIMIGIIQLLVLGLILIKKHWYHYLVSILIFGFMLLIFVSIRLPN